MNGLNKVLLVLVIVVFILCGAMFLDLYLEDKLPEDTTPSTEMTNAPETNAPVETTEPAETTQETTEATTEATTEPTTETTTEPTTVPTTEPETEPEPEEKDYTIGEKVAKIALAQVGKPFVYGDEGPDSFDASGLVQYCYKQVGIDLPRSTVSQSEVGEKISYEDLKPGDALFIWTENEGKAEFVGVYVGDGFYVAARRTGTDVSKIDVTTKYYKEHFVFGRRYY